MAPPEAADNEIWVFFRPNLRTTLSMLAFIVLTTLAGCGSYATSSASYQFDLKLRKAETSPIPGATAKVLPPPPGSSYAGPDARFCVTDAGYCPLASQAEPGQNCLCEAGSLMYGGVTGVPPRLNTTTD